MLSYIYKLNFIHLEYEVAVLSSLFNPDVKILSLLAIDIPERCVDIKLFHCSVSTLSFSLLIYDLLWLL